MTNNPFPVGGHSTEPAAHPPRMSRSSPYDVLRADGIRDTAAISDAPRPQSRETGPTGYEPATRSTRHSPPTGPTSVAVPAWWCGRWGRVESESSRCDGVTSTEPTRWTFTSSTTLRVVRREGRLESPEVARSDSRSGPLRPRCGPPPGHAVDGGVPGPPRPGSYPRGSVAGAFDEQRRILTAATILGWRGLVATTRRCQDRLTLLRHAAHGRNRADPQPRFRPRERCRS